MKFLSLTTAAFAQPVIPLGISALSLILLVFVLLSVPGPAQGIYWFEMDSPVDDAGATLKAGVMGWCWSGTSNCTYAALSENPYLNSMFDVGSAVTVKALVPLSCYWTIVCVVFWGVLTVTAPAGYRITSPEQLARHLRFNILESGVLCMQLFAVVLAWLAFGFTSSAFNDLKGPGVTVRQGNAMTTIAVAATVSLIGFGAGALGLHFRINEVDSVWKEEIAALNTEFYDPNRAPSRCGSVMKDQDVIGKFRASRMSMYTDGERPLSRRSTMVSAYGQSYPEMPVPSAKVPINEKEEIQTSLEHGGSAPDPRRSFSTDSATLVGSLRPNILNRGNTFGK